MRRSFAVVLTSTCGAMWASTRSRDKRYQSSRGAADPLPSPQTPESNGDARHGGGAIPTGRSGEEDSARDNQQAPSSATRRPVRTLYPKIRMRAQTERPAPHFPDVEPAEEVETAGGAGGGGGERSAAQQPEHQHQRLPMKATTRRSTIVDTLEEGETPNRPEETVDPSSSLSASQGAAAASCAVAATKEDTAMAKQQQPRLNEVQNFLETVQQQVEQARLARNQAIPYPEHPDTMVPLFRRVKRHTKMEVVEEDPDYPTFLRHDAFVTLPPTAKHPWVKNTPMGHVTHGDGQLGVVGTGEVGFEDTRLVHRNPATGEADDKNPSGATPNRDKYEDELALRKERRGWRGLQHQSILQRRLPQRNGKVLQDAVIKHSFSLTGRGVFATRDIKQGETVMVVQSSAQSLGVKGELRRLEDMVADILLATYEACHPHSEETADGSPSEGGGDVDGVTTAENNQPNAGQRDAAEGARAPSSASPSQANAHGEGMKAFLHDWILTGQPSSLVEHWPRESTQRVLDAIGGRDVLNALELHTIHIARLAAIIDLNSFLVESFYAERKGMAYFPEAGFLNHSCAPNATYDIMPEHTFKESDYYLDEMVNDGDDGGAPVEGGEADEGGASSSSSPPSGTGTHGDSDRSDGAGRAGEARDGLIPTAAHSSGNSAAEKTKSYGGVDYLRHVRDDALDLTETGAPPYLFCCRAEKDIAAGEEILISYVPPGWSFDNRQYVLHDRYHFWCKCSKCAPTLDQKYARVPRFLVGIVVLSIFLQGLVLYQRDRKNDVDAELERLNAMSEEERIDELRARGIDLEDLSMDAKVRHREEKAQKGRMGLFELLEREKLRRAYEIEGPISPNTELAESQNPYPRNPFGQ